ncbi:MAG: hypothetical protein PXY39_03170 [archaeon]|nr:hypothetical protein [archaeon]
MASRPIPRVTFSDYQTALRRLASDERNEFLSPELAELGFSWTGISWLTRIGVLTKVPLLPHVSYKYVNGLQTVFKYKYILASKNLLLQKIEEIEKLQRQMT